MGGFRAISYNVLRIKEVAEGNLGEASKALQEFGEMWHIGTTSFFAKIRQDLFIMNRRGVTRNTYLIK
jgi:hypothetical protein